MQRSSVGASGGISHPNHNHDRLMTSEKPFNLAVLGPHTSSSTWARSHRQGGSTQTSETGTPRGGRAGTLMLYSSCKTSNSISGLTLRNSSQSSHLPTPSSEGVKTPRCKQAEEGDMVASLLQSIHKTTTDIPSSYTVARTQFKTPDTECPHGKH